MDATPLFSHGIAAYEQSNWSSGLKQNKSNIELDTFQEQHTGTEEDFTVWRSRSEVCVCVCVCVQCAVCSSIAAPASRYSRDTVLFLTFVTMTLVKEFRK